MKYWLGCGQHPQGKPRNAFYCLAVKRPHRKRREKFIGSRFFLSVKDYGLLRTLKRETKRVERAEGLRRRSGYLGCFFF